MALSLISKSALVLERAEPKNNTVPSIPLDLSLDSVSFISQRTRICLASREPKNSELLYALVGLGPNLSMVLLCIALAVEMPLGLAIMRGRSSHCGLEGLVHVEFRDRLSDLIAR